ncbi:MAG: PAS domain S-box protein, partial [Chloroflexi bacterium]|nr:PAS domain S-box protein [Chloroflexota bacterium]
MDESQHQRNNQPEANSSAPAVTLPTTQMVDILESMNDALFAVDEQWSITYINRKTEEIWGQRREDLLGLNVWNVFPLAVGSYPYHAYCEAMQERRAVVFEYFAPGANRWLDARVYPNGTGLVVHLRDITERKATEVTEREQRQFAEALRDSLAALTSSLDVQSVMQQILDSAAIVVPSEAGSILLFEGNHGHVAYLRGFSPEAEAFFRDYQFPTMLLSGEPVLSDKQAYFVPDTHADPTWISLPVSAWIRSSIGMPIEIRGAVIGLLIVDSATPHHFKAADMEKLHAFAGYASLALENAQQVTQLETKVVARTAELNEAKERVEAILNNSPEGILLVYPDLRIQQVNAAFRRLFVYDADDAYYGSLYDLIYPADIPHVQTILATVSQAQIVQQVEMRCYRKNGALFEAELSISAITGGMTDTARFVCTLRDITERKQAQIALAEERNLLRTLIDTIPDTIYIKDINHRFVLINITGALASGWMPEEVVGKDDFAFIPQLAAQFYADEARIFQSGLPLLEQEASTIGPDGKVVWLAITKVPLRNLQGTIIGLVGINRDISAQKQRERQLRYYASLQENVSDAVITADLNFRIQSWNRAAETIYGWRAE